MGGFYIGSTQRSLNEKLGENPSILDYGGLRGNDITMPLTSAIAAAMASSTASRKIYCPQGRYQTSAPIVYGTGVKGITLYGDGATTIIQRSASLTPGQGMFDMQGGCSDIAFEDMVVDGNALIPLGLTGPQFDYNELHPALTTNSSFWVHAGAMNVRMRNVKVVHTGGYAVLINADAANITGVKILDCDFENCRPNLFGSVSNDCNYGSWNAGILIDGDGNLYAVDDVLIRGCTFKRIAGTAVWTHLKAITQLHTNVRVLGCSFEDIGLDTIQMAGVNGGTVAHNNLHRAPGYVTYDDNSRSVPRWGGVQVGTAIDTAGLTINVNYYDNTIASPNGLAINLDGFGYGAVAGNTISVPLPGTPQYTEDQIALNGPGQNGQNWVQGIFGGNTNNNELAGSDVSVFGNTLINLGGGGIGGYGSRNWQIFGNIIDHPAAAFNPPIALGNVGTGPYQRAYNNTVSRNSITWAPGSMKAAIIEDAQFAAFSSGDKNWIFDNTIISSNGNAYEFKRDPNTSSVSGVTFSSNQSSLAALSTHMVQRTGQESDSSSALRWYYAAGTSAPVIHMQLQAFARAGVSNPLLNVSANGAADTGAFTTGNRLTVGFDDCIATGKLLGDAFEAMLGYDAGGSSFNATEANLLNAAWGLLRFSQTNSRWEQSVSVSGGVRVWGPLSGGTGTLPGTPAGSLQFNSTPAGTFTGSINLLWDNTNRALTVAGTAATKVIYASGGYMQSDQGYLTLFSGTGAFNAPSGGASIGLAVALGALASAPASPTPAGFGGLAYNTGSLYWYWNGSAWVTVDLSASGGGSPVGPAGALQFQNSPPGTFNGSGKLVWDNTAFALAIIGTVNQAALTVNPGYINSYGGYVSSYSGYNGFNGVTGGSGAYIAGLTVKNFGSTGAYLNIPPLGYGGNFPVALNGLTFGSTDALLWVSGTNGTSSVPVGFGLMTNSFINAAGGFATLNTNFNAIQAPLGGVKALGGSFGGPNGSSPYALAIIGTSGAGAGASQRAALTWNASNGTWLWIAGTDVNISGGNDWFLYSGGAGLTIAANYANASVGIGVAASSTAGQALIVAGLTGVAGITLTGGYINSAQGFLTLYSGAGNAINAPSGSVGAGVMLSLGQNAGAPASPQPSSPQAGGFAYKSGSIYWYWNGATWAQYNFGASVAVTSVTGSGSGINVNPTTGAVVVSNTGVTSLVAGTGVAVSGATGAVTVSIGQSVATNAAVTFGTVTTTGGIAGVGIYSSATTFNALGTSGGLAVRTNSAGSAGSGVNVNDLTSNGTTVINNNHAFVGTGGVICPGVYSSSTTFNALSTSGGLAARTNSTGSGGSGVNVNDLTSNGVAVIDNNHAFVGPGGVNVGSAGITCGAVNPNGGFIGQSWRVNIAAGFQLFTYPGGALLGTFYNLIHVGGVLVSAS